MKNNRFIIDAHCHIFPDKIAAKAAENIGAFYGIPVAAPATVENMLALMERQGIDLSIVSSSALAPQQVMKANEFLLNAAVMNPNRIVALGTLHPGCTETELEEHVRFLCQNPFHGVKIHPDMLGVSILDPAMDKIYNACEAAKLPLLLHTGDNRYDYSNPSMVEKVLREHPGLTLIGGHFAGLYHYTEAADKLSRYDNLYCDCSSSFVRLSEEEAKYCIQRFGKDRVMFGTDFPVCIPNFDLDYLFRLGYDEETLGNLLWKNAARIYHLDGETLTRAGFRQA